MSGGFAYVDWPDPAEGWTFAEATLDRRAAFMPQGRKAALFVKIGSTGEKVILALPLDQLSAALAEINADPTSRLRVVDGDKPA